MGDAAGWGDLAIGLCPSACRTKSEDCRSSSPLAQRDWRRHRAKGSVFAFAPTRVANGLRTRRGRAAHALCYAGAPRPCELKPCRAGAALRRGGARRRGWAEAEGARRVGTTRPERGEAGAGARKAPRRGGRRGRGTGVGAEELARRGGGATPRAGDGAVRRDGECRGRGEGRVEDGRARAPRPRACEGETRGGRAASGSGRAPRRRAAGEAARQARRGLGGAASGRGRAGASAAAAPRPDRAGDEADAPGSGAGAVAAMAARRGDPSHEKKGAREGEGGEAEAHRGRAAAVQPPARGAREGSGDSWATKWAQSGGGRGGEPGHRGTAGPPS
jgi:hypothetical protein